LEIANINITEVCLLLNMLEELLEIVNRPLVDLVLLDALQTTHKWHSDSIEWCLYVLHEQVFKEVECRESCAAVVQESNCWNNSVFESQILIVQDIYFFNLIDTSQNLPHGLYLLRLDLLNLVTEVQELLNVIFLPGVFVDGFYRLLLNLSRFWCLLLCASFGSATFCCSSGSFLSLLGLSSPFHNCCLHLSWGHCLDIWLLLLDLLLFLCLWSSFILSSSFSLCGCRMKLTLDNLFVF